VTKWGSLDAGLVKVVRIYLGRDEKIGKKDQQDDQGSDVEREALWKKIGLVWHLKTRW